MPKGPLGGPRPLSSEQFTFVLREDSVRSSFSIAGPLGLPRPLAKPNPVDRDEMRKMAKEHLDEMEKENGE